MTTQDMRTIAAHTEMHHPARAALLEAADKIDALVADSMMLDWLDTIHCASFEKHYQCFMRDRTPREHETGGYNGNIDFFSIESQHLKDVPTIREAITKAMEMSHGQA